MLGVEAVNEPRQEANAELNDGQDEQEIAPHRKPEAAHSGEEALGRLWLDVHAVVEAALGALAVGAK
mgnify:CR=1 FL=1